MHIIKKDVPRCTMMCKLIGYTLFWIAIGMLFMLVIGSTWIGLILIAFFIILGYYLFDCR